MSDRIFDYVGNYSPVTQLLPPELVDRLFYESGVQKDGSPIKGEPHFKFQWHVLMDVFLTYTFEGYPDEDGENIEFVSAQVRATCWPEDHRDLLDQIPNLEPAIVIEICERLFHSDDWGYTAWVSDEYLKTSQGKLLVKKLMLAKLALNADDG